MLTLTKPELDLVVVLEAPPPGVTGVEANLLASDAWLLRALDAAVPVKEENMVVAPVEVMVEPPLTITVVNDEVVMAEAGTEVAPPTPPIPEIVMTPVEVKVEVPLVMTEKKVDVVMALAPPAPPLPEPPVPEGADPCRARQFIAASKA